MKNKKSCWFNTSWFGYRIFNKDLIFEKLKKEKQTTLEEFLDD